MTGRRKGVGRRAGRAALRRAQSAARRSSRRGRRPICPARSRNSRAASATTTISLGSRNGPRPAGRTTAQAGTRREAARSSFPSPCAGRRRRASDPGASAWVSANAGSGKTHVLTQRVLRLLLGGTPPSQILGLTFTKAAAANMASRIFRTLAEWTSLDDEALDGGDHRDAARGKPRPRRAQIRAAIVRPHDRVAGRPQDPDAARLLRTAAAALPVRGQCPRAFQGDRRARGQGPDGGGARPRASRSLAGLARARGALAFVAREAGAFNFDALLAEAQGLRRDLRGL